MLAELPPARRAWIEAKGREMAEDMIRFADAQAKSDSCAEGNGGCAVDAEAEASAITLEGQPAE
jgi:hypothetical protein